MTCNSDSNPPSTPPKKGRKVRARSTSNRMARGGIEAQPPQPPPPVAPPSTAPTEPLPEGTTVIFRKTVRNRYTGKLIVAPPGKSFKITLRPGRTRRADEGGTSKDQPKGGDSK